MNSYFVYGYIRSKSSVHGEHGSYYYIGKGTRRRHTSKWHTMNLPTTPRNIVKIAENMNEPDALQLEMLLIHLYGRVDIGTGCLLNLTDGGEGSSGFRHTPEAIKKMSLFQIGRKRSPEVRVRMAEANRRRPPFSEETKKKISEANKGRLLGFKRPPMSPETKLKISETRKERGIPSPNKGKPVSPETREKLRQAMLGKKASLDTRAKLSKNKNITEEHRAKLRENCKRLNEARWGRK